MQWSIQTYGRVSSTQDILKGAAATGAPEGSVVQADSQSAGYGRHGRTWKTGEGNFYCSLLLRPRIDISNIGQFGILSGVAVYEACQSLISKEYNLKLKWPNDVLIDGRKCAGILVESGGVSGSDFDHLIIGIGINLMHAPFEDSASISECFADEKNLSDRFDLRDLLLERIALLYQDIKKNGFTNIRQRWLEYGPDRNEKIGVKVGTRRIEGYFKDLDKKGSLVLHTNDYGVQTITAGEIYS